MSEKLTRNKGMSPVTILEKQNPVAFQQQVHLCIISYLPELSEKKNPNNYNHSRLSFHIFVEQ